MVILASRFYFFMVNYTETTSKVGQWTGLKAAAN